MIRVYKLTKRQIRIKIRIRYKLRELKGQYMFSLLDWKRWIVLDIELTSNWNVWYCQMIYLDYPTSLEISIVSLHTMSLWEI